MPPVVLDVHLGIAQPRGVIHGPRGQGWSRAQVAVIPCHLDKGEVPEEGHSRRRKGSQSILDSTSAADKIRLKSIQETRWIVELSFTSPRGKSFQRSFRQAGPIFGSKC